jgi:hypothetical protein
MIETVTVCDATHANIGHLPHGAAAGYTTGSADIRWTAADWAAHPGAVRIDQDPAASDKTADVLDVEAGAATLADCAPWAEAAAANFARGMRPGQRHPAIYMSLSMVTPVVNALIAGGIAEGVGLWIANWSLTAAQAATVVQLASGPFPVIGVQHANAGLFDVSVFSRDWLGAVSLDPTQHPARFRGEYITAGLYDLEHLAAKLGTAASTLLRTTATHYGRYDDGLATWLNAVASGAWPVTAPLPKGVRLWVA